MWLICCICLFLYYVFVRLTCGITKSSVCLIGTTAIVTGANSGLGYQTVLNLASRGCKVIMADVADMKQSRENIVKFTNNNNIFTQKIDLSSLRSVRDFAADIIKNEERLDILINNAGIAASQQNRTEDGLHPVMQINYFGHFLLTHLLIDLLKKSAPSRIVFSSSLMSFLSVLSPENLNFDEDTSINLGIFKKLSIYNNSKYALLIASDIFAEKLKGTGVTSNSVNPGWASTAIISQFNSAYKGILPKLFEYSYGLLYSKSPWEAAQTLAHVAVSKKLRPTTGKHFWDCKPFIKPLGAYNENFCKSIWEVSEKCVNLSPEEKL